MKYNSPYWDKGTCHLHKVQGMPCAVCIAEHQPQLYDEHEVDRVIKGWMTGLGQTIDTTLPGTAEEIDKRCMLILKHRQLKQGPGDNSGQYQRSSRYIRPLLSGGDQ